MKYVIMGLPGVGKTSVVKEVLNKTNLKHLHWGNLSEKVAKEMGVIKNIDELRNSDPQKQIDVRNEVVKEILEVARNGDILIETHAALKGPHGYFPGLTQEIIKEINPDVFIVVEAGAEFIMKRRKGDKTRERKDDITLWDVEESIFVTRSMVSTYAVLAEGTVFFVENKEGDLDYAVNRIVELVA